MGEKAVKFEDRCIRCLKPSAAVRAGAKVCGACHRWTGKQMKKLAAANRKTADSVPVGDLQGAVNK